jgi:hypothetical protein
MLRMLLAAAALLVYFTPGAVAQTNFVDWRNGTAVVRAASAVCRQNGIFVNDRFGARYRHPGLGDNGARARISLFGHRVAHNITVDGDFNNTFQAATFAVFVGGGVVNNTSAAPFGPYIPSIRMTKRTNNISETTPLVYLYVKIVDFYVGSDLVGPLTGCNLDLEMTILK